MGEQPNPWELLHPQDAEGRTFEVLVEGTSEKDPKKLTGYTRTNKTVNFIGGSELTGRLVMVHAKKAHPWGFTGELVGSE